MILGRIQPCFIPWTGYFEQVAVADIFVYLDDVLYTKRDWRNTNRLKSPHGVKPVFVPVRKVARDTLLNAALISYRDPWQTTLLNQITQWYRKAPCFDEVMPLLEGPLAVPYERLVDLTGHLNGEVLRYLGVATPIHFASAIPKLANDKNGRIIEICEHFPGVNLLYDGKSAQNFIDLGRFRSQGIEVVFQDYQQTPYPQQWGGPFEPNLSVIDLLMNCGRDATRIILASPRPEVLRRPPV